MIDDGCCTLHRRSPFVPVRSVEAFGLRLYPFPPGPAPSGPTASFVGVTRCSLKERKVRLLQQQQDARHWQPNATFGTGARSAAAAAATGSLETDSPPYGDPPSQLSSLVVEQGLVLMGGYLGTCGLQAISLLASWSGVSTSAGWISREGGLRVTLSIDSSIIHPKP